MTEPDITNITDLQERNGPFDRELTFESFVVGEANQLACQAARMVSDTPLNFCNPLLICGGTGQGKTHLMHAIGKRPCRFLERDGDTVGYIDGIPHA